VLSHGVAFQSKVEIIRVSQLSLLSFYFEYLDRPAANKLEGQLDGNFILNHIKKELYCDTCTKSSCTKLACLLFIVLIDKVLKSFYENCKTDMNTMKAFVDDMCIAEVVKYNTLPSMPMIINHINDTLKKYKMCLNAKKSNIIVIDNSRKKSYSNIKIVVDGVDMPVLDNCKLLGITINKKGDWSNHVNNIYSKASKKLYMIRKLKNAGFNKSQLVSVYSAHIRSILEYSCILWAFNITKEDMEKLNSIERRVLSIITGNYISKNRHKNVCVKLKLTSLTSRHTILLDKFSKKLIKSDRFKHWLAPYKIVRKTSYSSRYNRNKFNFRLVSCKYERYRRSTIPTLVKHLHDNH